MSYQQAKDLLIKYRDGNCTDTEKALVEKWLFQHSNNEMDLSEEELQEMSEEIWNTLPQKTYYRNSIWPRIAAVASIIVILSAGSYFLFHKTAVPRVNLTYTHDVAPGGNKAILTLDNGKQIVLANAKRGELIKEYSATISKIADGLVAYKQTRQTSDKLAYNIMMTPKGGQYIIILSDGTKVTLNAASSLKYPTTFIGKDRRVELTGEAYFEVAHNAAKPFKVTSKGQTVEVLGTHFNINSYADEAAVKTTLLEGSVKITTAQSRKAKFLKPGQQAIQSNQQLIVKKANIEQAVAWKSGYFRFHDENIQTVMRQLSRWYNVDVSFTGAPSIEEYSGKISRFKNISQVLGMLQSTQTVHFKVEGRSVIVLK